MSNIYLPRNFQKGGKSYIYNPFVSNKEVSIQSVFGKTAIINAENTQIWSADTLAEVEFDTIELDELGAVDLNKNGFVIPESLDGGIGILTGFFGTSTNTAPNTHHYMRIIRNSVDDIIGEYYNLRTGNMVSSIPVVLNSGDVFKMYAKAKMTSSSPSVLPNSESFNNKFTLVVIG